MSEHSRERSEDFLKVSDQFKLGALVTESSHPVTANLSEVARKNIAAGLDLLFQVDEDVLKVFREFVASGRAEELAATALATIQNGGNLFFTGCGSTGRLSILLDSVWRGFWQARKAKGNSPTASAAELQAAELENRTFSVMAGGDYALIKAVEGFEDFAGFGEKQIKDLGVSARDMVFAITEGGETSFVIGTAWAAVKAKAKTVFVYNNPDAILGQYVLRSREVLQDGRIEKLNLTTGPMAITGSTRMQATSIQLAVLLTVLEMVVRELVGADAKAAPAHMLAAFEAGYTTLRSAEFQSELAKLVALEERTYRHGNQNNYHANRFGIDVLTDTTERSPTFCTPPFRKFDDATAAESWSYLFVPDDWTDTAWKNILKRKPRCVEWHQDELFPLVGEEHLERNLNILTHISSTELMRFKVGVNGLRYRQQGVGDSVVAVVSGREDPEVLWKQLVRGAKANSKAGQLYFGSVNQAADARRIEERIPACITVFVPLPETGLLLDGVTRLMVKLVMNALSTCTMVRLGRVSGNYMVWVVPSNLKLIDRATRYIATLAGLDYESANEVLFEVIEYVEPRMKADQAYPPVVELAVLRAREKLSNAAAEQRLKEAAAA